MDPPKNHSFSHPNDLHASSGVQDLVAADLSRLLDLVQSPQLNSLELNKQWVTAPLQIDQPQQLSANSEGSVNQPREMELSPNTSSDISQFRRLLKKVTYNIESTSDTQSFSSPVGKVKEDVSTVPNSKRPCRESTEVEAEAEGSSQRILQVNSPLKALWEPFNILNFPEEEFKKAFRMSKATFDIICYELESVYKEKSRKLPLFIPVRQRVAVSIWRLATGEPLSEVSKRFGLEIWTCYNLLLEFCSAISNILFPKFVQWPNEERIRDIKRGFEMISGIPDVAGSVCTVKNRKASYPITVHGVVDFKGERTWDF